MEAQLATTNLFLGIMAAVSVLEALLVVGIGIGAFVLYWRVAAIVNDADSRYIAPMAARVNAILDDAKSVSTTIREETARVDRAINHTVDRMDGTATRVRSNLRSKTARIVGFVRGARVVLETILHARAA